MSDRWAGDDRPSATARTGRDRQVIVVGRGLSAAAAGAFLAQAGFDPVIAPASRDQQRPEAPVVPIWRSGLDVLERLGLRRPVERAARSIEALDCPDGGEPSRAEPTDRPVIAAIGRTTLGSILERHLLDRLRTVETPVTEIDQAPTHAAVTFADSVRERFDVAVTSTQSVLPTLENRHWQTPVDRWWFEWPDGVTSPPLPTHGWQERDAAFTVPAGDRTGVELVAAGDVGQSDALDGTMLRDRFGAVVPNADDLFDALDPASLSYRRTAGEPRQPLVMDRMALIGPAAWPFGTSNPLTAALALEDAWVVADALAYGPESVSAALDAYRRRRRRRHERIDAHEAPKRRAPTYAEGSVLDRVVTARTVAFGHVFGHGLPNLARDVPDRL